MVGEPTPRFESTDAERVVPQFWTRLGVATMAMSVGVMLAGANLIANFINRHPSMKVLALSFLLMVGVLLLADAFGRHISKGYVYFAMAYALGVELINIRRAKVAARRARAGG